jgi:hypothetical protein
MATKTNKMTDEQAAKYLYNLLMSFQYKPLEGYLKNNCKPELWGQYQKMNYQAKIFNLDRLANHLGK